MLKISEKTYKYVKKCEEEIKEELDKVDEIAEANSLKVLMAFNKL